MSCILTRTSQSVRRLKRIKIKDQLLEFLSNSYLTLKDKERIKEDRICGSVKNL
jgi:hypothetical protein